MLSSHLVEDLHRVIPQRSQEAGREKSEGTQFHEVTQSELSDGVFFLLGGDKRAPYLLKFS